MRLNDGSVIPAFIGQAFAGEDLTIFGDGSQTRSFCYVDDLVEGIYSCYIQIIFILLILVIQMKSPLKDFAEEIIKLTGTSQKVVYHPLPTNDPLQSQPDTQKQKKF
jgi:dTDP-glucose 4,6-dehydratase